AVPLAVAILYGVNRLSKTRLITYGSGRGQCGCGKRDQARLRKTVFSIQNCYSQRYSNCRFLCFEGKHEQNNTYCRTPVGERRQTQKREKTGEQCRALIDVEHSSGLDRMK